ncbi:MAG TPA: type II secretion system protein [Candidatus Saccharimonadia bacterium]|nr:type II secretion system protein [Candidatus Saccharimonadia bacterium]
MVSLKNRSKGFTIVELLIVIVVIAILATLVIVTFTGIQQKARDSQRQTDVNALDSHLEAYYAENGKYPTLTNLTTASWVTANMKGLDPAALVSPKGATIVGTASSSSQEAYGYVATPTGCDDASNGDCTGFTLTAQLEGSSTLYSKSSNT